MHMGPMKKATETLRTLDSAVSAGSAKLDGALDSAKEALKSQTAVNVALTIGVVVAITVAIVALSRSGK